MTCSESATLLPRMSVVVFPVVLLTPGMPLGVPPLVVLVPAIFPGFAQFVPGMLRLSAVPTVVVDRFVQVMIGFFGPMLAFCFAGADIRRSGQQQKPSKRCHRQK